MLNQNLNKHNYKFDSQYIYFSGDGNHQNELFKDTERTTFELNHDVSSKVFYTLILHFGQEKRIFYK